MKFSAFLLACFGVGTLGHASPSTNSSSLAGISTSLLRGTAGDFNPGVDRGLEGEEEEEEEEEAEVELDEDGIERGTKVVNNIAYVLKGYDLLKGNPLDTDGLVTVDHGFRQEIFVPGQYEPTPDREYYKPKGVSVVECEGCNLDFSSYTMQSTEEYVSALSAKASLGIEGGKGSFKGAFSLSAEYAQAEERFNEKHESSTCAEVSCCVYQAELSTYDLPPFSDGFAAALEALAANPDENKAQFVQEFGTHYVKQATMGSLFGEQTYFTTDAWMAMAEQSINVELAASASGLYVSGNLEAALDYSQSQMNTFRSSAEKRSVYARGAKPPANGDVQTWLDEASKNPVPTYIELRPIHDLIDNVAAKEAVKDYLKGYCEEFRSACVPPHVEEAGGTVTNAKQVIAVNIKEAATQKTIESFSARTTNTRPGLTHKASTLHNLGKFDGDDDREHYEASSDNTGPNVLLGYKRTSSTRKGFYYEADFAVSKGSFNRDNEGVQNSGWKEARKFEKAYQPAPPTYTCPTNTAIVRFTQKLHTWECDKYWSTGKYVVKLKTAGKYEYEFLCASFKDITIETSSATTIDTETSSVCPDDHVWIGVDTSGEGHSNTNGAHIYSETIKMKCAPVKPKSVIAASERWQSPTANTAFRNVDYVAPEGSVMVGIHGHYVKQGTKNGGEDHEFKFVEMIQSRDEDKKIVLADTFKQGGNFIRGVCPHGKAMVGMISIFHNYRWDTKARCASLKGYNLQLADGSTFKHKNTNEGLTEYDWSYEWKGAGASFAVECPDGKVMAGFQARRGDKAGGEYGATKILCLALVKV